VRSEPVELQDAVDAALEAAAIPPERRGRARVVGLGSGERALYRLVLSRFAAGRPPAPGELAEAASTVGLEQALAALAAEDLVHTDPATGDVLVAYPFSGRPRGHRVLIDGKHWVEAMCAIDALGIAPMLELPIEIFSRDPTSGAEVWVRIDPGDGAWWEPEQAVVLTGSSRCSGPNFESCCSVLNFFESGENALQYLIAHPDVNGHPISLPEAIEAGRIVFGHVFEEV
jgi:hypothetical protein